MAMKRCPICGERYSDTYKDCPFCEEEEAYQDGEEIRRRVSRGGRRVAGRRKGNLLTPILIVLIVLMASLLAYLLWGDAWTSNKDKEQGGSKLPTSSESIQPESTEKPELPDSPQQPNAPESPDEPDEPDEPVAPPEPETEYEKLNALPNGLTISNPDFTLSMLGETHTVRASGGSSSYTWVSEDPGIASVDSTGKVTAISNGTVNMLVTDGSKKATFIVRVKASGSLPSSTTEVVSGGSHELNREDMTLKVGESFQLKLTGVTTALTWSSSKTGVATVSGNGTVVGVAPGNSTVTVSWDGGSLSCIVRVK